jgi:exo-beta-1,3-glucanase (GH17 family)
MSLPVGNSDAGSYFNNEILAAVDYGVNAVLFRLLRSCRYSSFYQMANVHPWFANVAIDQAASWTASYFQQTDIVQAQALPNNPTMYIAETGWPSVRSSRLFTLPTDNVCLCRLLPI